MAETLTVEPDLEFTKAIIKGGGESLKKCFQCGTCSASCELSPDDRPFPRKEMIWASWGLKEKLINDPDIWLCHQCGDCSTNCPRGAKPGDVLSALRNISYRHFAFPSFMGKLLGGPAYLPIALAIPVVFILAVIFLAGGHIPEGEVHFADFLPHAYLNVSFAFLVLLTVLHFLWGVNRFWGNLSQTTPPAGEKNGVVKSFISSVIEIAKHERFQKCSAQRQRFYSHLLVLWGFVLLLVVTVLAIGSIAIFDYYPLPFSHPIKIAGNIGGLMLIIGCIMMIYQRTANKETNGHSSFTDWAFLVCLLGVGLTGVVVQFARMMDTHAAYYLYFVHLVFVFYLIAYVPYTKFGHFVYRTVAMTYAKHVGRD